MQRSSLLATLSFSFGLVIKERRKLRPTSPRPEKGFNYRQQQASATPINQCNPFKPRKARSTSQGLDEGHSHRAPTPVSQNSGSARDCPRAHVISAVIRIRPSLSLPARSTRIPKQPPKPRSSLPASRWGLLLVARTRRRPRPATEFPEVSRHSYAPSAPESCPVPRIGSRSPGHAARSSPRPSLPWRGARAAPGRESAVPGGRHQPASRCQLFRNRQAGPLAPGASRADALETRPISQASSRQ